MKQRTYSYFKRILEVAKHDDTKPEYQRFIDLGSGKIDLQELQDNNAPDELFKSSFEQQFGEALSLEDTDVRLVKYAKQLYSIDPTFDYASFMQEINDVINGVPQKDEEDDDSQKDEDDVDKEIEEDK